MFFERFGDQALNALVADHLSANPHEVAELYVFASARGLPRERPIVPAWMKTNEVAAEAVMVLRRQQSTPTNELFPSPSLGKALANWVYDQLDNTGHATPRDAHFPWSVISMRDWLINGTYNAHSDEVAARFWKAADEMTREPYWGPPPGLGGARGGGPASTAQPLPPIRLAPPPAPIVGRAPPVAAKKAPPPPRVGRINPWEAIADPAFSSYLRSVAGGYGRGWIAFRDGA